MKAFLAILLIILLGVGLGFGIASLRIKSASYTPPPDQRGSDATHRGISQPRMVARLAAEV
jgi:hypothetical protein